MYDSLRFQYIERKDFALKEQMDWVIMNLHAGGFWNKWNSEMFNPKVVSFIFQVVQVEYYIYVLHYLIIASFGFCCLDIFYVHMNSQIFLEDSRDTPEKLNIDQMAFAFGLLIIGLITGLFLFLFEFFCKKQDACLEQNKRNLIR